MKARRGEEMHSAAEEEERIDEEAENVGMQITSQRTHLGSVTKWKEFGMRLGL